MEKTNHINASFDDETEKELRVEEKAAKDEINHEKGVLFINLSVFCLSLGFLTSKLLYNR